LTQWQGQSTGNSWRESLQEVASESAAMAMQPGQALNAAVSDEDLADLQQMLSAARQAYGGHLPTTTAGIGASSGSAAPADPAAEPAIPAASTGSSPGLSSPVISNLLARLQGLTGDRPASATRSIDDIR